MDDGLSTVFAKTKFSKFHFVWLLETVECFLELSNPNLSDLPLHASS